MLTLRRIAIMKAAAGTPWPGSISTYTYNGAALMDVEIPLHSRGGGMSKRHYELMIVACALGHYERDVKIEDRKDGIPGKQESPDFFVEFSDRRVVGIEVARLTDENRTEWNSFVDKVNAALENEFSNNQVLAQRFAVVSLSIRLAHGTGATLRNLVAAIVDKLLCMPEARIRPGAIVRATDSEPILNDHGFFLIFNHRHNKRIDVTPHLPNDVVDGHEALIDLIKKKAALKYDTKGHPLWLALAITDPFGQLTFDLNSFAEKAYAIGQFDRLLITNGSQTVTTTDMPLRDA